MWEDRPAWTRKPSQANKIWGLLSTSYQGIENHINGKIFHIHCPGKQCWILTHIVMSRRVKKNRHFKEGSGTVGDGCVLWPENMVTPYDPGVSLGRIWSLCVMCIHRLLMEAISKIFLFWDNCKKSYREIHIPFITSCKTIEQYHNQEMNTDTTCQPYWGLRFHQRACQGVCAYVLEVLCNFITWNCVTIRSHIWQFHYSVPHAVL